MGNLTQNSSLAANDHITESRTMYHFNVKSFMVVASLILCLDDLNLSCVYMERRKVLQMGERSVEPYPSMGRGIFQHCDRHDETLL